MFTGLVAGIGTIKEIAGQGGDMRLGIATPFSAHNILPGDSVAVNGVCLTVETVQVDGKKSVFTAYVSAETLKNSNLGNLKPGSPVNLELALALGDRLGGHIVSGHADGVARVVSVQSRSDSHLVRFECAPELDPFIVSKGSICVDGISLTVTACGLGYFELNVIPETWQATIARHWQPGYSTNIEVDMLGKYVAKMLGLVNSADSPSRASGRPQGQGGQAGLKKAPLDLDFFIRNGFN